MLKAYRGSPPHARGKDHLVAHQLVHAGITPACAGKSAALDPRSRQSWGHPRMRGEKVAENIKNGVDLGSPPHARGKVCANGFPPVRRMDHPRIRGEKALCQEATCPWVGSPPHTRGKAQDIPRWSKPRRITPAYAGKREAHVSEVLDGQDHPRIRGEKRRCM